MRIIFIIIFIVVFVAGILNFLLIEKVTTPVTVPALENTENIMVKSIDFSKVNPEFLFSVSIPKEFEVEYIPKLKAMNIYNPKLTGGKNIDKSEIYITHFKADRFLTLNTVEITKQDKIILNGQDAVLYEITKKPEVPNFSGQPNWRNFKHKAIDIRFDSANPTYFYSFAYNPNLSAKIIGDFINSLFFYN